MTGPESARLALLLLGGFRQLIDALHAQLADEGHGQARPLHGFALQAIGPEGATVALLAQRLGVTKQAAAKTVDGLERLGYAERRPHTRDRRSAQVRRTPHGEDLLHRSARILVALRREWGARVGDERLRDLEEALAVLVGEEPLRLDLPGWLTRAAPSPPEAG